MTTGARTITKTDFATERFKESPSFNFTWGYRKPFRCVKDPHLESSTPSTSNSPSSKRLNDGGIEAVREKLMLDFYAEVNQLRATFLNGGNGKQNMAATEAEMEPKPWNLRIRRPVSKDDASDNKRCFSPTRNYNVKSPVKYDCINADDVKERKRVKFSVSLSKKEIEADFLAVTGVRPARRPKKRAKYIQKQLDAMSPGFWLTEITADMYKVNEQPLEGGKR